MKSITTKTCIWNKTKQNIIQIHKGFFSLFVLQYKDLSIISEYR